jgi:hypothetical protein
LDILERRFAHSARWTPAIKWEAGRLRVPSIDWIGTPLPIGGGVATLLAVQLIRRGLGATQTDPATLHLGEAEAIHFIENYQPTWTFVSDDRPAVDFALRRGLNAIDTQTVLADCYAKGEIGCPDAFELLCQMAAEGRGVQVPPSHWYVCPPGDQSADSALRPHVELAQSRAARRQQMREPHPQPCQNNRIWTGVGRLTDFYLTVHIGGSSVIRLVTCVGKSRVNQSLRAGWRVQAAIDRARLRRAEASTP